MSSINHIQTFHLNYDVMVKIHIHFLMTENPKHSVAIHEISSQPDYQISLILPPEGMCRFASEEVGLLSQIPFSNCTHPKSARRMYYSTKSNPEGLVRAKTKTVQFQIGLVDD